ncbi:Hypothetical protein Bdt_1239 [Bdellovibrio bacteriovorus str. Tiberius]|uniref:Uncharacterized protein n=1 Tax=Bdellovibrio bacteriovorus str. Tiberius TaxID=1069642 RepID=K7YTK5_BDEBC|nr:Hypothetical protein Bdt_1239 [Bdellovibrio bacteriovorus str. Tiberius]
MRIRAEEVIEYVCTEFFFAAQTSIVSLWKFFF